LSRLISFCFRLFSCFLLQITFETKIKFLKLLTASWTDIFSSFFMFPLLSVRFNSSSERPRSVDLHRQPSCLLYLVCVCVCVSVWCVCVCVWVVYVCVVCVCVRGVCGYVYFVCVLFVCVCICVSCVWCVWCVRGVCMCVCLVYVFFNNIYWHAPLN
jgi:hypothetical protein